MKQTPTYWPLPEIPAQRTTAPSGTVVMDNPDSHFNGCRATALYREGYHDTPRAVALMCSVVGWPSPDAALTVLLRADEVAWDSPTQFIRWLRGAPCPRW